MAQDANKPTGSGGFQSSGAAVPRVNNFMSISEADVREYGLETQTTLKTATINFDSQGKRFDGDPSQVYFRTLDSQIRGLFATESQSEDR